MSFTKTKTYLPPESKLRDYWSWTDSLPENGNNNRPPQKRRAREDDSVGPESNAPTIDAESQKSLSESIPSDKPIKTRETNTKTERGASEISPAAKSPVPESEPPKISTSEPNSEQTLGLETPQSIETIDKTKPAPLSEKIRH
ncbi:MAG: hypothetical protein V2A61_02780, partial [Calditrichota bacterium]